MNNKQQVIEKLMNLNNLKSFNGQISIDYGRLDLNWGDLIENDDYPIHYVLDIHGKPIGICATTSVSKPKYITSEQSYRIKEMIVMVGGKFYIACCTDTARNFSGIEMM